MSEILELEQRLNMETGRIAWQALQPFFAKGQVIRVAPELDLLGVARAFVEDASAEVKTWMNQDQVAEVSAEEAGDWYQRDAEMWAVVVAPWVLVQEAVTH
jgi:hypothetical protein